MKKNGLIATTAVLLLFSLLAMPSGWAQDLQQQEEKTVDGTLKSVDLVASKVVVAVENESDVTLEVDEGTEIRGTAGELLTLEQLGGQEGAALTARYTAESDRNVAISIALT